MCYWGPDTLAWTPLGGGYSHFARMVLGGGLAGFYQDLRWPGWQEEVAALGPDQGISVYPFLFTAESRPVTQASRRPVPFAELLDVHAEAERQIGQHHFSHTWLDRGGPEADLMELNGWTSPQMLTRYGASARAARARRTYDRIMDERP